MGSIKNPLFIFSFKIIIFAILFGLCISFIETFTPKEKDERLDTSLKYLKATKDSAFYDVLFFSNSHIFTAIDPLYFKSLTGLENLHICSSAQRTIFTVETIKQALEIHKPRCIVFDLSRSSTFIPEDEKTWHFNSVGLNTLAPTFSKAATLLRLYPFVENKGVLLRGFSDFTATLTRLNEWKSYNIAKPTAISLDGYYGFLPLTNSQYEKDTAHTDWNEQYLNFSSQKDPASFFDDLSRSRLSGLMTELKEKGIKVVLISSLKVNSATEKAFAKACNSLKELSGENLSYINLNTPEAKKYFNFSKKQFSNNTHLTHYGALNVTEYVAPLIKRHIEAGPGQKTDTKVKPLAFQNGLRVRDYQIVLNDFYTKTLQIYFDEIPKPYFEYNTVVYVYPAEKFRDKLSNSAREGGKLYDATYFFVKDYYPVKNGWVANIQLKTELREHEIEKIELWFYKPNSPPSGKYNIYKAEKNPIIKS